MLSIGDRTRVRLPQSTCTTSSYEVRIVAGPIYGFELAELASLPASLLTRARLLAERLRVESEGKRHREAENERKRALLR